MQSKKLAGNKPSVSTQKYLDIAEIKEDCVILKDGTLRVVLLASSLNFALKSEDEQNATIQAYVVFLNSLTFPIQIVIQSRKLNIDDYVVKLRKAEKEQTNELLRMQIADYRQYIKELVEMGEIMTKRFYVVVPYSSVEAGVKGFFTKLIEAFIPASVITLQKERFQKYRREIFQRVDHIVTGLYSIGLNVVVLDTQSLIELFYNTYNPTVAAQQKLVDVGKLRVGE